MKKPTAKQYEGAKAALAISYCPTIYPCGTCGWPYITGRHCNHCGSTRPSQRVVFIDNLDDNARQLIQSLPDDSLIVVPTSDMWSALWMYLGDIERRIRHMTKFAWEREREERRR